MTKWTVDQSHSHIGFEVKHMMVSKVKGAFDSYTANVEADRPFRFNRGKYFI